MNIVNFAVCRRFLYENEFRIPLSIIATEERDKKYEDY